MWVKLRFDNINKRVKHTHKNKPCGGATGPLNCGNNDKMPGAVLKQSVTKFPVLMRTGRHYV